MVSLLEFKDIVKELVMLFLILGARRKQALFTINIENIIFADNKVILLPNKTLKRTNPNRPLEPFTYHKYEAEEKLCIVNCLQSYLEKRNHLVNDEVRELLIRYGKSHKPVSSESVGRWIKNELTNAGVDTTVFKQHTCRSASVSKAKVNGVPTSVILEKGCWKRESTFKKCYYKDKINSKIQRAELKSLLNKVPQVPECSTALSAQVPE